MLDKIKQDLTNAIKEKNELKVSTLRLLIGAIQNFAIEKESTSYKPTDDDVVSVIQKQVKQRKDSIEQYKAGSREELAEKEEKELKILESYLPEQMSAEEIASVVETVIKETGASSVSDIGKVMGKLSGELKGKADMGVVSTIVREKLQ